MGNGSGGFAPAVTYAAGIDGYDVTTADLTGNGLQDIVAADLPLGIVAVLLNNGSGGFDAPLTYATGGGPFSVAVADINGDGRLDLVVDNVEQGVAVLLGNGSGGFSAPITFAAGTLPTFATVADLSGDGKPDIIANDVASGAVDVLRNATFVDNYGTAAVAAANGANTGLVVDTSAFSAASPTVDIVENTTHDPLGIAAPADPNYPDSALTVVVGTLPTNGTITLADGTTPVTAGETLTVAQLSGLEFSPTTGLTSSTSSFTYSVSDPAPATVSGAVSLVIGPTAPGAPALLPPSTGNVAISNTPTLTGTGIPGDTIILYDGATSVGSAVVGSNGTYTVAASTALPDGSNSLTTVQYDPNGSHSPASSPPLVVTVLPAAPTLVDDALTTPPAAPEVSGTAPAGDTVNLYDGATSIAAAPVGGTGDWSYDFGALAVGVHTITASTTDGISLTSAASPPLIITVAAGGSYTVASTNSAGDTVTGTYNAASVLQSEQTTNAASQVLVDVNASTAVRNIYDSAGNLIGTITEPSTAPTYQPAFTSTPQTQSATSGSDTVGSVISLLAESNVITTAGADTVDASGGAATIFAAGPSARVLGGPGPLVFIAASSGADCVTGGSGAATVFGSTGGGVLSGGSAGGNVLVSGGGTTSVFGGGGGDLLVAAGGGATTLVMPTDSTAFSDAGQTTIFAASGDAAVGGGSSNLMVAGSGPEALYAGAASSTLFGGTGADTLTTAANGQTTMLGGSGGTLFIGNGGAATAFGGAGNDTLFAGSGSMVYAEGPGADLVVFGSGSATISGGAGIDSYVVANGSAGGQDVIDGFKVGTDQLGLFGYAPGAVQTQVTGGSTILTLSDHTVITLVGVTQPLGASLVG
jgi:Ca2+-binding RTX toxin-like protein